MQEKVVFYVVKALLKFNWGRTKISDKKTVSSLLHQKQKHENIILGRKKDLQKLKKNARKGDENTKTNMNNCNSIQIQRRSKHGGNLPQVGPNQVVSGPNEINKRAESWLRQKHLVLANGDSAHSLLNTLNISTQKSIFTLLLFF